MSVRAVLQPNGLFARFSTIGDTFTHANHTREELWNVLRNECGVNYANDKIERAIASPERFEAEINIIKIVHGPLEAERVKAILSIPEDVVFGFTLETDEAPKLVTPMTFRGPGETFDVEQEIKDLQRHVALMPETGDEDEDNMRNTYLRRIVKCQTFIKERDAATTETQATIQKTFYNSY